MIRAEGQPCWVLHRRPWRESSLIMDVFVRAHGRQSLVARGARGDRSPWRGLTEPFVPLQVSWTRRGELGTLTDLESISARHRLHGRKLWCGLYANELLLKLLEKDEPAEALFDDYAQLLEGLVSDHSPAESLRRFEFSLLQTLGVAPDLQIEAQSGKPVDPQGRYDLDPESGLAESKAGSTAFSGDALLALARVLDGTAPGPLTPEQGRQARLLTRRLLDHQLGGQRLKTRELFRSSR